MKKLSFLAIALAVLAMVGCKPKIIVNSIQLNKTTLEIAVDDQATLVATVDPASVAATWKSSNTAVATVANGVVTGIGAGVATITATAGDKSATCQVTVTEPEIYDLFNIDGFGLFGEEFIPIPGTDTTLVLSGGDTVPVNLNYIYWYGWDGDLQYVEGSGWAGDGIIINGGQVPVYVITGGAYKGYYVGTSYWTIGYEKNPEDTIRPYNMMAATVDVATYGDWVSYVHGDSAELSLPLDQKEIWSKNTGANFTLWYTTYDINYAEYGLYYGYINKMVYRDAYPEKGIEAAWSADVDWAAVTDDRVFGFKYDTAYYAQTYVPGDGGEYLFTRPYDFEKVNRIFNEDEIFEEYNQYIGKKAPQYTAISPATIHKELPVVRGNRLTTDKFHMAR